MSQRQAQIRKIEGFIKSLQEQQEKHGFNRSDDIANWQRHLELLAKKVESNGTGLV